MKSCVEIRIISEDSENIIKCYALGIVRRSVISMNLSLSSFP